MEAALELEDDVFFADLSKQISLLIMDDDDDEASIAHCPPLHIQTFNQAIHPSTQKQFLNYDQQMYKRESKGTGVFIPRSSHQRRKIHSKQGRFTASGNNKFQSPSENNSRGFSHKSFSNNINPSYDSFNSRRL